MSQAGLAAPRIAAQVLEGLYEPLEKLVRRAPRVRPASQDGIHPGDGQPVIVFPLEGQGPDSTAGLRQVLEKAGFRPHDWGHGVDRGTGGMGLNLWLRKLEECVIDVFEVTQAPVTLLGWGLSGIYARELAKRTSPLVRQVITLGSPFNTAADPQRRCPVFRMLEAGAERLPLAVRNRLRQRPPVPCTAIYSRDDGVVRWEQCVESETAESENVEIPGARHHELAEHPRTLEVVTHRLAQPEGRWHRFAV